MFFGKKRVQFRDAVYDLIRMLKIAPEKFPPFAPIHSMIEECRLSGFTLHETALMVAYSDLARVRKESGRLPAKEIYNNITSTESTWVNGGYVRANLVDDWHSVVRPHIE